MQINTWGEKGWLTAFEEQAVKALNKLCGFGPIVFPLDV